MIKILKPTKKMRKLLSFTPLQYMIDSVEENPKLAKLYVNETETTCFVLLGVYLFVTGEIESKSIDFLKNQILSKETRDDLKVLIVFYPNEDWKIAITSLFSNRFYIYQRSLYRINPTDLYNDYNSDNSENIFIINTELLNSDIDNKSMIFNEVTTYDDMNDFINRGIGFTPIFNNKVCGFCTSEYPTKNGIAIGIEVLEEHQKMGIAKDMTKLLLNEAYKRNLTVYWECWKNNLASAKTALSCGFEKVADYPIIFIEL